MLLSLPRRTTALVLAVATALLALLALASVAADPAAAARKKSCTRGGAKVVDASPSVRVVRAKGKKASPNATRTENLHACWLRTGKRVRLAQEVDLGDDNTARTQVEIVQDRWVGVRAENEGGVSIGVQARVYDARKAELVHSTEVCDAQTDDYVGPDDVAFLDGGGMAFACQNLLLYRTAGSTLETLEPDGTNVRQVAVSHYSNGFGQRLFWTVGDGLGETTRSLAL